MGAVAMNSHLAKSKSDQRVIPCVIPYANESAAITVMPEYIHRTALLLRRVMPAMSTSSRPVTARPSQLRSGASTNVRQRPATARTSNDATVNGRLLAFRAHLHHGD